MASQTTEADIFLELGIVTKATSPPRPTVYPSGPLDEFGQGRLPHASHSLGSTQNAIIALSLSEFVLNRKPPGVLRTDS